MILGNWSQAEQFRHKLREARLDVSLEGSLNQNSLDEPANQSSEKN